MKYLFILFLLCTLVYADYYPIRFQEGFTYSSEHTQLLETTTIDSEVIVSIPPGELLEIKEFTGQTLESDSCNWGWYRAEYRLENSIYEGFVLDKHLAFASVSAGSDSILVFKLDSFNTTANAFEGEMLLIAGGRVLQSLNYRPNWTPYGRIFDYDVTLTEVSPIGLSDVKKLFIFYSGLDVSELQSREDVIALTNSNTLIEGPHAISIYKEDENRSETTIILPSDSEGNSNQITLFHTVDFFEESSGNWICAEEYSSVYQWENNKFIEINTTF